MARRRQHVTLIFVRHLRTVSLVMLGIGIGLSGCEGPEPVEPAWEVEYTTTDGAFLSVWGPDASQIYAVGGQRPTPGAAGSGIMVQREASGEWQALTLPAGTPNLNWVYGIDGELWVAAHAGKVLHRAGESFELLDTGLPDVPLWGVWGTANDDLWVVGGEVLDPDAVPHLLHFDGEEWEDVALPAIDRPSNGLLKVWGTAANDVHAVGMGGLILHYDGDAWVQAPSGTTNDLVSLWGTGPEEIVAIGGRSNGTLVRYDGEAWAAQSLTSLPGQNGVWMNEAGACTIVGTQGSAAQVSPASADFLEEDPMAGFNVLHAVFGFDDDLRFAVGGNLDQNPPYVGLISARR